MQSLLDGTMVLNLTIQIGIKENQIIGEIRKIALRFIKMGSGMTYHAIAKITTVKPAVILRKWSTIRM